MAGGCPTAIMCSATWSMRGQWMQTEGMPAPAHGTMTASAGSYGPSAMDIPMSTGMTATATWRGNAPMEALNDKYEIGMDTYRPRVEGKNTNQFYDERAKCEIRILDGDLIYILQ